MVFLVSNLILAQVVAYLASLHQLLQVVYLEILKLKMVEESSGVHLKLLWVVSEGFWEVQVKVKLKPKMLLQVVVFLEVSRHQPSVQPKLKVEEVVSLGVSSNQLNNPLSLVNPNSHL